MEEQGSSSVPQEEKKVVEGGSDTTAIPSTMRAVFYNAYGEPSKELKFVTDFPVPKPKKGEVLIRVHAAAINPVDWKMVEGYMKLVSATKFPTVPGFDISGVVVQTGPSVKQWKAGDEVYAMNDRHILGAFAEYVIVPAKLVAHKPKNLSHIEAASIPLAGLTTYQGIVDHGKLTAGQKVLIIGGSSGTGSFGVQLAKHIGAEVTAVCSTKNVEFVQGLGASRVIDYTKEDWSEVCKGENFDLLYDCVGGGETWLKCPQVLKPSGRFVTIAGDKQEAMTFGKLLEVAGAMINRKFWGMVSSAPDYTFVLCEPRGTQLAQIAELIEKDAIKASVSKVFTFDEVLDMFAESMSSRARGKLVLAVVEDENSTKFREEDQEAKQHQQHKEEEGKGKDKETEEEVEEVKEEENKETEPEAETQEN